MSNNISFTGRLGGDAEQKAVGDHTLTEFSVGNNVGFGDRKVTNWFKCTIWGTRGQKIQSYLTKGKQVFITGELTLDKYEKDGVEKMIPKVNVNQVDFIGDAGGQGGGQSEPSTTQSDDSEGDLPF